ncbi:MAG: Asp-tRNA(Asn)/Glu-tRNA(Gln) amidotransferase GatCAB subunit B, partial [Ruminococcus sp.]|nr:Asp-tRNA(Asn)/Glu-tRNA(Gln) amidotransferase GatCAB subunit B [Ruminococcus sp.]
AICNFITGELLRRINLGEIDPENIKFTPESVAKLIEMSETDVINKGNIKDVFRVMIETGAEAYETAKSLGFVIENDTGKMTEVIKNIIAQNPKPVEQYRNGETKVFGFLMGQCSKALKGVATSKAIKDELEAQLRG